jgi:alginate O-acetyltransferase complex protein AlgI
MSILQSYLPRDITIAFVVAGLAVFAVASGFVITRLRPVWLARLTAWAMVLGVLVAVERLTATEGAGLRMLALISVGLMAMKATVSVETVAAGGGALPFFRWLAFTFGWFGMQPRVFAKRADKPLAGVAPLIRFASWRIVLGACLMGLAWFAFRRTGSAVLATALALPGVSLILHFGVLNLAAAWWRMVGFDCKPLFREPLRSQSLAEFWGRRWNMAFSEMTSIAVYRPLSARFGKLPATLVAFLMSGLLHEMAISLPVRAGFGLPLLYFFVHGALVLVERELARRGRPVGGVWGRVWTIAWLVAPMPILFHPPFLRGVVWPLIGIDP